MFPFITLLICIIVAASTYRQAVQIEFVLEEEVRAKAIRQHEQRSHGVEEPEHTIHLQEIGVLVCAAQAPPRNTKHVLQDNRECIVEVLVVDLIDDSRKLITSVLYGEQQCVLETVLKNKFTC